MSDKRNRKMRYFADVYFAVWLEIVLRIRSSQVDGEHTAVHIAHCTPIAWFKAIIMADLFE